MLHFIKRIGECIGGTIVGKVAAIVLVGSVVATGTG